jgi:hypothetical protein
MTMKTKAILAFLVAILAVAITATFVSAASSSLNITDQRVFVDGLQIRDDLRNVAVVAG